MVRRRPETEVDRPIIRVHTAGDALHATKHFLVSYRWLLIIVVKILVNVKAANLHSLGLYEAGYL